MKKLFIVLLGLASVGTFAQDYNSSDSSSQGRRGKRRPPQEALNACSDLSSGDSCEFTSQRDGRSLSGTCFQPSTDKPLACKPNR